MIKPPPFHHLAYDIHDVRGTVVAATEEAEVLGTIHDTIEGFVIVKIIGDEANVVVFPLVKSMELWVASRSTCVRWGKQLTDL